MHRWLGRVWRTALAEGPADRPDAGDPADVLVLRQATHERIAGVSADYERRKYNSAIAKVMELVNAIRQAAQAGVSGAPLREAVDATLLLLAPICPFITEELWARLGRAGSVHEQRWPEADEALLARATTTLVVQVNGKVRARVEVPVGIDAAEAERLARQEPPVVAAVGDKAVRKAVHVPDKLLNLVVG
jgi:leucyl-tRNA synthetase